MQPEDLHREQREALISEMTLSEKVMLAAGSDIWRSSAVPRLGIPSVKVSDGPNGVRGESKVRGMTSACFPVGSAMASTWNRALIRRAGEALAEECRTKNVQVLLGPTVNIHRSPLAGRNFECFSEDPFLTAEIAHEWIQGVQSQDIGCCIKHFVCNDSEYQRHSMSSEVDERTLHEIYLPPFEKAVRDTHVWAVMSAYNKVNGISASANGELLTTLLKEHWQFDGVVISDWHGTYETIAPAVAGLDLEMPGPAQWMGEHLLAAVIAGQVPEAVIDDKVRRQLRLMQRTGVLNLKTPKVEQPLAEEQSVDRPEDRALIRQLAAEGMVLLKNEGVLPLKKPDSIALIGPNAVEPRIMGGGSSFVMPHYTVTPLEGLQSALPDCNISLHRGCHNFRYLPLLPLEGITVPGAEREGLRASFFNNVSLAGEPIRITHPRRSQFTWFGTFDEAVGHDFSVRLEADIAVNVTGNWQFSLISAGLSRLKIDDQLLVDNWSSQQPGVTFFGNGSTEVHAEINLKAGVTAHLEVEYSRAGNPGLAGLRIGMLPPQPVNLLDQAVTAAMAAEAAVVIVGLDPDWESEGFDRVDMELPGQQLELIKAIIQANSNTVVVLNAGSPLNMMDWLSDSPAVLQAWYPGQEFGNALADILSGSISPSGKLPTTFPRRLEDNPAYLNYPGENGEVRYGENLFVGYRYYDEIELEPAFPFGHGLSYTEFDYTNLSCEKQQYNPGEDVVLGFDLSNTGDHAGAEVVQLYVTDPQASLRRPQKELKGFQKIFLAPGETCRVEFVLTEKAFSFYDPAQKNWRQEPGEFIILIAASSRHIRLRQTIRVEKGVKS